MVLEYSWSKQSAETNIFIGDPEALLRYPIIVQNAGNSRWIGDARIRLTDSHQCALELVTAGNCLFVQNGREYVVEPGMMFLQRKRSAITYGVGPAGFVHKRFVGITGSLLDVILEKLGLESCDVVSVGNPASIAAALKRIRRILQARPPGYQGALSHCAYDLLVRIADVNRGTGYPAEIQVVINFMEQNLGKQLSTCDMAKRAGISEPHLYRLFKAHVKDTPNRVFMTMKLKHAAQLVRYTHTPMKEIALMHGFEDPSYFSKQFKKTMGASPQEYREQSSTP